MASVKYKTKDYNLIKWSDFLTEDVNSPTGLVWKINSTGSIKVGNVAGYINTNKRTGRKCLLLSFKYSGWLIHRILWVMRNGYIDNDLNIDHIDGNALNNSVENLRLVQPCINSRNRKQSCNNSSGVTGVNFVVDKNGDTYARARWANLEGKYREKHFNCKNLGILEAFAMACAYRDKIITELNNCGAGYSDRHGLTNSTKGIICQN
jgi:hypothetical protein